MRKTVVIVDNEILLTHELAKVIDDFGDYHVLYLAENGQKMMDRFKQPGSVPDIVLLDIHMPVKDGFETAQWLTENFPSVKILALSVDDDEVSIIKMIRCGAKGYLLKNIDKEELLRAMNMILEKGYYHSEWLSALFMKNIFHVKTQKPQIALTDRERQFIRYAASELTYKEIADKMCLSPRTLDGYRDQLYEKLGLRSRVGLVISALKEKILNLEEISINTESQST